jgi:hypothetical protein
MIDYIHLVNNISHDIYIIAKNSDYYLAYINLMSIGALLILNIYYTIIYYYQYHFVHDIYVRSNLKMKIILNMIALIFVIYTIYKANSEYIKKFLHNFYSYIFNSFTLKVSAPISSPSQVPVSTEIKSSK